MGYISGPDHFINYLEKAIRESDAVREDRLLSKEFYLNEIFEEDLEDEFTWDIYREGAQILEEENVLDWITNRSIQSIWSVRYEHILRDEFRYFCDDVADTVGVYSFRNLNDKILYIGRSVRLGKRMPGSFERFNRGYNRVVYCKTMRGMSAPDAAVLELYLINHHNPPFNKSDNFPNEELTIEVEPIPDWNDAIRVNRVDRDDV
jgi:hypothetical protein